MSVSSILGERGRFELVADTRAFIPEDQPERLVAAVRVFLA